MLSDPSCPACGGPLREWRSMPSSEPALTGRRFSLRRCDRCGTAITVDSAPARIHDTGAYGGGRPRLFALARPLLASFDRQRLLLLRELVPPPARLVDAGAGRGRFVAAARQAGYDAYGIEPSARGVAAACSLGVPIVETTIEAAQVEPGSLDAVTLWHVLEHLEAPAVALERIAGWLRPGGALLVGVPNLASFQAWIGAERWYHLDVPRHRTHFTAQGVDALLRTHAFEPVRVAQTLLEHNPFGLWQSLVNRVTRHPSYLYNLLKRNVAPSARDLAVTVGALPLVPVAVVVEWVAGALGRGGTVAVLARRVGLGG